MQGLSAPADATPIFMYHSISDRSFGRFRPFTVTPRRFHEHLRLIEDEGFTCLTISQLVEARENGNVPQRSVCLTFDDGYADFYLDAVPILERHNCSATLYMVAGFIGASGGWHEDVAARTLRLMNWSELSAIHKSGMEIGAHTMNHKALDSISLAEAREEIMLSKHNLEEGLSIKIQSFAYPYGYYSPRIRALLPSCGFTSACAVHYATSRSSDDPFALRRHIVRHDTSDASILAILRGSPPSSRILFDRARSNLWSAVRQVRYGR